MPVTAWRWFGMGRAARAGFRAFIAWLAGRQRALWVPTWADDLRIVQIHNGCLAIDVEWVGALRLARRQPGRRDIRIALKGGVVFYRRIIDALEISTEIEALYFDAPISGNLTAADIAHVCWMSLSRADSDTVEIEHVTDGDGLARAEVIFRGVRDDEF